MSPSSNQPLALTGGTPGFPEGPPVWPPVDKQIERALTEAYRDGSWGKYHGPNGQRLTAALSSRHAEHHTLLCCSGTLAVELALRGLGVGPEDEVLVAGYDFPGNFRAIECVGARPVLVDIDRDTWSFDPDTLDEAVSKTTRAVIVSHLHGGLVPMEHLMQKARQLGISVVEDACQAPGAVVDGQPAGTWGDVGALSFGGSKLLTAGRGGALITARDDVLQRAKVYANRGNDAFPLSELQAAVLLPQLEMLEERNAIRRENVDRLRRQTEDLRGLAPLVDPQKDDLASYYKLAWRFDAACFNGVTREDFIRTVQAEGIALDSGFRGFAGRSTRRCRKVGPLVHSHEAAESTLVLHHPILLESAETIDRLADTLAKVCCGLGASTPDASE